MTIDATLAVERFLAEGDEDGSRLDPTAALRDELVLLWSDLSTARNAALSVTASGARWTIQSHCIDQRIARISLIVGPAPWMEVGVDMLVSGLYRAVYDALDVDYEPPDAAQVAEVRAKIGGFG